MSVPDPTDGAGAPLTRLLIRQIVTTGPLTVADYMSTCLLHPHHGYYTGKDPLGARGDFTTAPEISQMFGELIGLSLAQAWLDRGAPDPVILAELGPGRGTLMHDALRATRGVPGFHAALRLHLVEPSPVLRAAQAQTLAGHAPTWHDMLGTLPELPLLLIANEMFDALPIRQFLRDGPAWRERMVTQAEGKLCFGLGAHVRLAELDGRLDDAAQGDMVELCRPAEMLAAEIGDRLRAQGGVALIVDYGADQSRGDTFQALRNHRPEGPLENPGRADLTAHVAFGPLARAAGCMASALTPQGVWLERLGITERARSLARALTGDALDQHIAAHRRLTHPDEMGHLFRVLSLSDNRGPIAGLDVEPSS